jgi:tetratricopeptide (TPR) repeat protein
MKVPTVFILICLSLTMPSAFAQGNGRTSATATSPAIPEEARRHFVMGTALFKDAKTPSDFVQVESEFKQAADLAPKWPDARYNLALAKEAAGDYSGAMADLKLYLQFQLPDAEARKAQDKIYVLEAKAKVEAKNQAAAREVAAAEQERGWRLAHVKKVSEGFRGKWYLSHCFVGKLTQASMDRGCTWNEQKGANWTVYPGAEEFEIENDGTIKMNSFSAFAGCKGVVFGVVEYPADRVQ